jgi:cyclin-dependent kinase regulatory subunit CKS1
MKKKMKRQFLLRIFFFYWGQAGKEGKVSMATTDGTFSYSAKYTDEEYEYRHVIAPTNMAIPRRLLAESEWRALGITQSIGWEHYALHRPEPHVLLFRKRLPTAIF